MTFAYLSTRRAARSRDELAAGRWGDMPASRKALTGGTACADVCQTGTPWNWIGQSDQSFCISSDVGPDRAIRLPATSSSMSIVTGIDHISSGVVLTGATCGLVGALEAIPFPGTARGSDTILRHAFYEAGKTCRQSAGAYCEECHPVDDVAVEPGVHPTQDVKVKR